MINKSNALANQPSQNDYHCSAFFKWTKLFCRKQGSSFIDRMALPISFRQMRISCVYTYLSVDRWMYLCTYYSCVVSWRTNVTGQYLHSKSSSCFRNVTTVKQDNCTCKVDAKLWPFSERIPRAVMKRFYTSIIQIGDLLFSHIV